MSFEYVPEDDEDALEGLDEYRELENLRAVAVNYDDERPTLYGWANPRNGHTAILADSDHVVEVDR